MEIINDTLCPSLPAATAATIGFFDGVHLGHQFLLQQVKETARANNLKTLVITFREPPRKVLDKQFSSNLITTFDERIHLIAQLGIDYCYILDFNKDMAKLTSEDFIRQYLHDRLHVKILLVGYDHHFGSDHSKHFEDYQASGRLFNIDVRQASEYSSEDFRGISSSAIRDLIRQGDLEKANKLTCSAYTLSGRVIHGKEIGRTIGFPTANIELSTNEKILPPEGVYAVTAKIDGSEFPGVANWGKRPTVNAAEVPVLEIHLLNYTGNLYDSHIHVLFRKRLRPEKRFNSLGELQHAILQDIKDVKNFFASQHEQRI